MNRYRILSLLVCLLILTGCNYPSRSNTERVTPPTVDIPTPMSEPLPTFPPAAAAAIQPTPTGPAPSATPVKPPPKTIILIVVDSTRADHLTPYGYARNTTPNLDQLVAQKGVRFTQAIATATWTCPSVAALLTGRTPTSLGTNYNHYRPSIPDQANTLAEYLQAAGYYTAGFVPTYCTKAKLGMAQGFNHFDDSLSDRPTSNKVSAAELNTMAMDWLEKNWFPQSRGKPLFLMLYYFDPHVWYNPPPPYDKLYDPDYNGTLTPDVYKDSEDVTAGKIAPTERDIQHLISQYDGEITYWDEYLGKMLKYLSDQGLMENSLLVVTADHGEQFGTHGKWVHGNSVYREVLHVPLFMRYDGVIPPGRVVNDPVQNYDLTPTILDWVGIPRPADLQATSLIQATLGNSSDPHRPVYSEIDGLNDKTSWFYWLAPRVSMYAVEQDGWKLIHVPENPKLDELYQLQDQSPYETENMISTQADRSNELLKTLETWFNLK